MPVLCKYYDNGFCKYKQLKVSDGVCAFKCDKEDGDWRKELKYQLKNQPIEVPIADKLPHLSINDKLSNFKNAMVDWAKAGFKLADDTTIEQRRDFCKSCEFWNKNKCSQCGCSRIKWFLATSKCPINKW